MKTLVVLLLLPVAAWAAGLPKPTLGDLSLQTRLGFDSNPVGAGGAANTIWGDDETLTYAAGAGFSLRFAGPSQDGPFVKLGYQGERVQFDRWSDEDFSTHRLPLSAQLVTGTWKFTAEGASLYIDGSRDTLISVATINANAISIWRERREQWQHRLRLLAQSDGGTRVMRASASLLAYDYRTRAVAGKVAFADRSDSQVGFDLGWKAQPRSLWLAGIRAGQQSQGIVPLPKSAFDYSNNYGRLALGWEGRLPAGTTLSITAGPDFRRYTGAIDPTVFLGGRDRTSLWFEGSLTAKPHPAWTVSAKATRFSWLSSTGKSAYYDSSAEAAATWTPRAGWNVRLNAKVHRCDYFPTVRDDWEWFVGAGVTRVFSPRVQLSFDVLRQQAWNNLPAFAEREFQRAFVQLGTTIKL